MERAFSPACERNQQPILDVFKTLFADKKLTVFEFGSGTGQHALHIANHMKNLDWHPSDLQDKHESMKEWLGESVNGNIHEPVVFEVGAQMEFVKGADIVFSANVVHIISWKQCKTLFKFLSRNCKKGAQVLFYGPFNYHGEFTSDGNRSLDAWLKDNFEGAGIRAFEDVVNNMAKNGFSLLADIEMPANNRILHFKFD